MTRPIRLHLLLATAFLGVLFTMGKATAAGEGPEASDVGTQIYSPSPLIPNQSFTLKMQITSASMKILHDDMMHNTAMSHPRKVPCMMSQDKTHPDMVDLTCIPAP